jgi:hypothetical protein
MGTQRQPHRFIASRWTQCFLEFLLSECNIGSSERVGGGGEGDSAGASEVTQHCALVRQFLGKLLHVGIDGFAKPGFGF